VEEGWVSWPGELLWPGGGRHEIRFRFTCPDASAATPRIRPFLLACLVPAMRLGLPLHFELPVDETTLHNLMEWQEAMVCWMPGKLKVVPIRCPVAPEPPKVPTAAGRSLTAFSGGVDSCFTAHRHTAVPESGPFRRCRLTAGLMVHGFDIPEDQPDTFASAFLRSQEILRDLGLEAYRLETNLRTLEEAVGCDWEQETHGIWLAATLACLEPFFERVLIPSSYAFDILKLPWGSNPVTDPLFSSQTTPVWHDGAAWNKLDKVRFMAWQPAIQRGLRVCWQGARLDRNCGHCYKCIATQVCCWLSGVPAPAAFPQPCVLAEVAGLNLKDAQQRHLLRALHVEAVRQGMIPLAGAIRRAQLRHAARRLWRGLGRPRSFLDDL
jgi:hypothetical protein